MLKDKNITIKETPELFDIIYIVYSDSYNIEINKHKVCKLIITSIKYDSFYNTIKYICIAEDDKDFETEFVLKYSKDDKLSYLYTSTKSLKPEDFYLDKNDAYFECSNRIQEEINKENNKIVELEKLQIEYKKQYEKR